MPTKPIHDEGAINPNETNDNKDGRDEADGREMREMTRKTKWVQDAPGGRYDSTHKITHATGPNDRETKGRNGRRRTPMNHRKDREREREREREKIIQT